MLRYLHESSVTWEDEGSPWSYWTVEDVEYNVEICRNVKRDPENWEGLMK